MTILVEKLPPARRSAASRLRALAGRLEPRRERLGGRSPAPLVRIDGRWWRLDEILSPSTAGAPPSGDA